MSRPLSLKEMVFAFVVLGGVACAVFAPHLREGGFYLDDWSNAALSLQPPGSPDLGNALSAYSDVTIFRPVLVLYVPLAYFVLGMHMHYHLLLAVVLAVLGGTMFYGVLRMLQMPWAHAGVLAALAILFPWSDSTRLWATADQVSLSILFMMGGLLTALLGLDRRSVRLHVGAVALYLLSILTYEVTLPVVACAGLLYCLRAGWKVARLRWLADLTAVVVAGTWVGANTERSSSGVGGALDHLWNIASEGLTILSRAAVPLGSPRVGLVVGVLVGIVVAGFVASRLLPGLLTGTAWGLRAWLLLIAGGVIVAAAGWAMFIPADPYYTPTIFGEVNRVNGMAAFGLVLVVYGAFGVVGTLIGQLRPNAPRLATGVTVSLGILLLASYAHVLRRHIEIWNVAFFAETYALSKTKEKLPHLPPGTTVFAASYPAYQAPGVPILATTWDYDGMIKMEYDDSSLSASPVLPGLELACRPDGVSLERDGTPEISADYGAVRLLDLQTGRHAAPRNRPQCKRLVGSFVAGPLFLSPSY